MPIRARIIKSGNKTGLRGEVEIEVQDGHLVLRAAREPRSGWATAFEALARAGEDRLVEGDAPLPTLWDEQEWQWP